MELGCGAPTPAIQLRERFFGEFELGPDTQYDTVWQQDVNDSSHTTFGAEAVDSVRARSWGLVCELEKAHEDATIVLVAHGDTLQILQTAFCGVDARVHRSLKGISPAEWRPMPELAEGGSSRQLELVRLLRVRPGAADVLTVTAAFISLATLIAFIALHSLRPLYSLHSQHSLPSIRCSPCWIAMNTCEAELWILR